MGFGPDKWIIRFKTNPKASLRLFCFPYAGGGASIYRLWHNHLPDHVELCALQPPGREGRISETPLNELATIVAEAATALHPWLDRPFVLFGHSLGATIAYETARVLATKGLTPQMLVVSGRLPSHCPSRRAAISHLPEPEFLAELLKLKGTPREVLENRELVDLLLPLLRADFRLADFPHPLPGGQLTCPVLALGSEQDELLDQEGLRKWQEVTQASFQVQMFPGDHFYLNHHRDLLVGYLSEVLKDQEKTWKAG